jgi:hypothetical protein
MGLKYLKRGNSKLSDNTLVWNIPAGMKTCGRVCKGCYAIATQDRWKNVKDSWEKNYELSQDPQKFFEGILEDIEWALTKSKKGVKYVRIHGSGDFYNYDYIVSWSRIIREARTLFPEVIFYGYTKNFKDFPALGILRLNNNLVLHDSTQVKAINYAPKETLEQWVKEFGGFVCPHSKDRSKECGSLCTWCMEKENEGVPIYFEAH